jgi:hypothetical protein
MSLVALLLVLLGCTSDLVHIEGTTTRISPPTFSKSGNNALQLYIFSSPEDCSASVAPDQQDLCLPFVDRATGQVRVAFQMRVDGTEWPVPELAENFEIFHKNQRVLMEGLKRYEVIPHEGTRSPQLFILLIDSSGSMGIVDDASGRTRMDKLKAALLRKDVVEAFFPADIRTAVVPLIFKGSGTPVPLGGKWVVDNKKEYRQLIQDELQVGAGFTFLYNAVDYATSTLLEVKEVKSTIELNKQAPTVIALTDGFNNESPDDTCAANAPRLEKMLGRLDGVRRGDAGDVRYRPTVYTVGLGRSAWKNFKVPDGTNVGASDICRSYAQQLINGGVETRGVDNAALSWIARTGGGSPFISRTTEGLAEAFKAAAAMRYRWFEVRYQIDPFHLRRAFDTKLSVPSMRTESTLRIHPSGWLDGPPGKLDKDGWAHPSPFRLSFGLVLPILGALATLAYLPAARFNVARALFSRVARKRKSK